MSDSSQLPKPPSEPGSKAAAATSTNSSHRPLSARGGEDANPNDSRLATRQHTEQRHQPSSDRGFGSSQRLDEAAVRKLLSDYHGALKEAGEKLATDSGVEVRIASRKEFEEMKESTDTAMRTHPGPVLDSLSDGEFTTVWPSSIYSSEEGKVTRKGEVGKWEVVGEVYDEDDNVEGKQ